MLYEVITSTRPARLLDEAEAKAALAAHGLRRFANGERLAAAVGGYQRRPLLARSLVLHHQADPVVVGQRQVTDAALVVGSRQLLLLQQFTRLPVHIGKRGGHGVEVELRPRRLRVV